LDTSSSASTRRHFMQTAGSLGLAGTLLTTFASQAHAQVSTQDHKKVGNSQQQSTSLAPVLFYTTDGHGATGIVDSAGQFHQLQVFDNFATGWTHVVSASSKILLFYNTINGTGATGLIDDAGVFRQLQTITNFSAGWTHIITTEQNVLLFYNTNNGAAVTGTIDPSGFFHQLQTITDFATGWNLIAVNR